MANLHFFHGVMSSSKSAALIMNAFNQRKNGIPYEVIKPSFDKRFATDKVVSRIGLECDATAMPNLTEYEPAPDTQKIFVDEVQFFAPSDIDRLVQIADGRNIIVMCYGLLVDSNEHIFPASQRLIEVGAKMEPMKTTCEIHGCTKLATHHLRFDGNGNVIREGDQFALGANNYKSVCRYHFNKMYRGR